MATTVSPWLALRTIGWAGVAVLLLTATGCCGCRTQAGHALALHTHLDRISFGREVAEDPNSTSPWGGVAATIAIIGIDAVMLPAQVAVPGGRRDLDHVLAVGMPLTTHLMLVLSRSGHDLCRIPVTWGDHCLQESVPAGALECRLELISPCLRRMVDLPPIQPQQGAVELDVVAALRTQPESIPGL